MASALLRCSSQTWFSRAPCKVPTCGTSSTRMPGRAIHETGFVEIVYADDLNGIKEFEQAKKCQSELHNCLEQSEPGYVRPREGVRAHRTHAQPHSDSFKLLGVPFDCKLRMDMAVSEVVSQASWKLTTILRARRFHDVPRLVQVYISKVLSFVEYRTSAVYHAAKTTLAGIDAVRTLFLRECGLPDEDALLHFNLAPLQARRDIAMLGLLHRSLGHGPRRFRNMFLPVTPSVFQKHNKQLCSHRSPRHLQLLARSALGLVDVHNLLLKHVVEQKSVEAMQHQLQMLLKFRAANGDDSWLHLLATCPSVRAPDAFFFLRLRHPSFLAVALQSLLVACGSFVYFFCQNYKGRVRTPRCHGER